MHPSDMMTHKNEQWSGHVYIRAMQCPVIQWTWETANKKKIGSVWKAKNWSMLRTSKFIKVALRALAVAAIVAGGMHMQHNFDETNDTLREELHVEVEGNKMVYDDINSKFSGNPGLSDFMNSLKEKQTKAKKETLEKNEKAMGGGTSVVTTFGNLIKNFGYKPKGVPSVGS